MSMYSAIDRSWEKEINSGPGKFQSSDFKIPSDWAKNQEMDMSNISQILKQKSTEKEISDGQSSSEINLLKSLGKQQENSPKIQNEILYEPK